MRIFPAIDLYEGNAVRLLKGDYANKTVYSTDPAAVARDFQKKGAKYIHLVDLEGAKTGGTPNFETIVRIHREAGLFTEVGGGIRSFDVMERYLENGIDRVILGTAAVENPSFLKEAVASFGERIALSIDIRDGSVATKGWTETSAWTAEAFLEYAESVGVRTIICTDISKDGMMQGTNRDLYRKLSKTSGLDIIASGGVSSMDDIKALKSLGLYGAIVGKAYYTGAIDLEEAIRTAQEPDAEGGGL